VRAKLEEELRMEPGGLDAQKAEIKALIEEALDEEAGAAAAWLGVPPTQRR